MTEPGLNLNPEPRTRHHSTIRALCESPSAPIMPAFSSKNISKQTLQRLGHAVDDHGTTSEEPVDYPPICIGVGRAVAEGRADRGIVLGGSGQGEQIAANKVRRRPRRALQRSLHRAAVARAQRRQRPLDGRPHRRLRPGRRNSRRSGSSTAFEGGRHQRRIDQISEAERRGTEAGTPQPSVSPRDTIMATEHHHPADVAHARRDRSRDRRSDRATSCTARTAASS